ncbi:MAG TPA: DUF459 domain-containing protein [Kamptonema sp.]|nr:DUF459 domain-containing protein [Kamptonema sp.]
MKDREFLLMVSLVTLTLIFSNFSLFLKSLASSKLVDSQIQQAVGQLKIEGIRKNEQEFWSKIKEVDFDKINRKPEIAVVEQKPAMVAVKKTAIAPKKVVSVSQKSESKKLNKKSAIAKPKVEKPYQSFLFVGDSIMLDLGTQIQYALRKDYQLTNARLDYKVSSGLNRIDYYDWYARTTKVINDYKPDVLVIMFGGNDDQDIIDSQGKYRAALTEEWKKAYRERVEKYAKLVSLSSVRKVYWIGQPMSNRQRYQKYFLILNNIYSQVSKSYPKIKFISTWETFSEGGKYATVVADRAGKKRYVKVNDGVHFTTHGAKIIGDLIIDKMVQDKILKAQAKKS